MCKVPSFLTQRERQSLLPFFRRAALQHLRHLRFRVTVVVLQPGARARDPSLLTLDPSDESFEGELVSIADRLGTAS